MTSTPNSTHLTKREEKQLRAMQSVIRYLDAIADWRERVQTNALSRALTGDALPPW